MSVQFLKQIESILNSSKFQFKFEGQKLSVSYKNNTGFFSIPIDGAELVHKKMLYDMLTNHKNKISGEVPHYLLNEVKETVLPVKEEKQYTITKEIVYFDPQTFKMEQGDTINLNGKKKAQVIEQTLLPDFKFVYIGQPTSKHPGIAFINEGYLGTVYTPEWAKDMNRDPLPFFIDRVKQEGPEKMKELLKKMHTHYQQQEAKVLADLNEGTKPTKVEIKLPTTEAEAQEVANKIIEALKGEDEDIFYSWGIENIATDVQTDLSDLSNPVVSFPVDGYLFDGTVKVTYNCEKKSATIELIDEENDEPVLLSIDKIKLAELQDAIDRLVEYDGDFDEYVELIKQSYPEDHKQELKIAA